MQLPFEASLEFYKFCIYLTLACMAAITICLPVITIFLFWLVSDTKQERTPFQSDNDRIADELEKLRYTLSDKRASEKRQELKPQEEPAEDALAQSKT